jgi:hypothetical protein
MLEMEDIPIERIGIPVTISPLDKHRGRGRPRTKPIKEKPVKDDTITKVRIINKSTYVSFN